MYMEQPEQPATAVERELVSYSNRRQVDPGVVGVVTARRRPIWIMGLILVYTIMSLMVVKVASTAALYQQQQQQQQQELFNHIESIEGKRTQTETQMQTQTQTQTQTTSSTESNSDIEKMRAKLQQLQLEQQQQYRQQQQQQMQLQLQQMQANGGGEGSAYLLERADDIAPVPIYGTWRTKARRPLQQQHQHQHQQQQQHQQQLQQQQQLQLQHAISLNEVDDNHLYERLPKRSATMTPLKGVLRDQMPRPPRLATQMPSASTALLRRQYSETPGTLAQRDDFKPKPFHFPYDGPLPEQFHKGEAERELHSSRPELNNIQDILQHLHINGVGPSKLPPMMMMPTGLHIAGSFKNFKSSGIGNFFRGKRQKKQMQFSIPLPLALGHMPMPLPMTMPMPMSMPMQLYGSGPHQRVAIEQLYPYKPRSPQDINLLAMQSMPPHKPVSKKKKKKQLQQLNQSNQNLLLEHGSQQQHFVSDPYVQHYPPIITLNATRQPQLKRVPFKVNLDIYPVLPPSRPMSVMRHPFQTEYALPTGGGIYQTPFKFPTQSSNPVTFPDQATRYSQQHHNKYPPPVPDDCIYGPQAGPVTDAQANQIMLHLNVFPKQKPAASAPSGNAASATATIRASTNPFYNNNYQRNSIHSNSNSNTNDLPPPNPPSPIEPRQAVNGTANGNQNQNQNQNQTQQSINRSSSISRSDHLSLIDFEHPIVAADVPELPQPSPLMGVGVGMGMGMAMGMGQRYGKSSNIDQLAAEAQTASLFRFPVEDLIQFQVDDAL